MKDNDTDHEFEEKTDDERLMVSNDDRVAMEIVEHTIKRGNHYKFQIAMPSRHIKSNMHDNYKQAESCLYQQCRTRCKNVEVKNKYI